VPSLRKTSIFFLNLNESPDDPNVVRFQYPPAGGSHLAYVKSQVVLELGTHAEFVPHERFTIPFDCGEGISANDDAGDVSVLARVNAGISHITKLAGLRGLSQ
jgi:hypothetical protein